MKKGRFDMKKFLALLLALVMTLALVACGNKDDIVTMKLEDDFGRDINLANATTKALQMFLQYLLDRSEKSDDDGEPTPTFGVVE